MDRNLKKILIEYLSYRRGEPDDYLFCKGSDSKKPLSDGGIKNAVASYNKSKGVCKTSCHVFRNYFAKHYLLNRRGTNESKIYPRA